MKNALINYIKNVPNDELYTPYYAIELLIKYLPKGITIWEPTDFGDSNITKCLIDNGFKVISSHKKNFDFLLDHISFAFDFIITNPPYSIKDDFIKRCYDLKKPFALLLPLTSLEGVYRGSLFRKYGIDLLVLDKRINYMSYKKTCWFNTSWFCFGFLPKQLIFEEVSK